MGSVPTREQWRSVTEVHTTLAWSRREQYGIGRPTYNVLAAVNSLGNRTLTGNMTALLTMPEMTT